MNGLEKNIKSNYQLYLNDDFFLIKILIVYTSRYDLKNHPQNKSADVRDDTIVPNARPDIFGRNVTWEAANITWNDVPTPDTRKWGTV